MKRFLTLLFAVLVGLQLSRVEASSYVAKAEIDTPLVIVGMPRILHLEVTVPETSQVLWPIPMQTAGFPAIDYEDNKKQYLLEFGPDTRFEVDTVRSGGMMTLQQNLQFFVLDSAAMVVPPFQFVVDGRDTVMTQVLALKCDHPFELVPEDPQATQDLKDVMIPAFVLWDYIWWIFWVQVACTLTVLSLFAYHHYRKHRKEKVVAEVVAPEKLQPAHVIALQALSELAEKKLWQSGQPKLYYTELTDILRRYIEERYHVSAMECTTDEILSELIELTMAQRSSYNNLKEVLQLADYVKFAKYEPLPDENQMSFMNSRLFIEQTKESLVEEPLNKEEQ